MTQSIILALVIIFLMAGAFFWMWKLSKWLIIPIQIILFALLVSVVIKVFVTKDNAERLNQELEKSGISEIEQKVVSGAIGALKNHTATSVPAEQKMQANEEKTERSLADTQNEKTQNIKKQEEKPQEVKTQEIKPQEVKAQQKNKAQEKSKTQEKAAEINFVDLL